MLRARIFSRYETERRLSAGDVSLFEEVRAVHAEHPRTFPEFYPDKYGNGEWRPPRLAAAWKPQRLIGEVWAENDYPGEGAPAYLVPVFSPRLRGCGSFWNRMGNCCR